MTVEHVCTCLQLCMELCTGVSSVITSWLSQCSHCIVMYRFLMQLKAAYAMQVLVALHRTVSLTFTPIEDATVGMWVAPLNVTRVNLPGVMLAAGWTCCFTRSKARCAALACLLLFVVNAGGLNSGQHGPRDKESSACLLACTQNQEQLVWNRCEPKLRINIFRCKTLMKSIVVLMHCELDAEHIFAS